MLDLEVQEPYYSLIKEGTKKIEGRLAKPKYLALQPGDFIRFNLTLVFELRKIVRYATFREMLQRENFKEVIPHALDVACAESIYKQFYTLEQELLYGVLALHI